MAELIINGRVKNRVDTTANWEATNPVLYNGEIGIDTTGGFFKVGDGVTPWITLKKEYGKDTYALAVASGYAGTEASFYNDLVAIEGLADLLAAI